MSDSASNVISLTPADVSIYEDFRRAEMAADAGRPKIEEMIAVTLRARDRLGNSMMAALRLYGVQPDPATMREYVLLRYLADVGERLSDHKAEVVPIIFADLMAKAPARRRA